MRAQDHVPLGNYSKDTAHVPVDTSLNIHDCYVMLSHQNGRGEEVLLVADVN